MSVVRSSVNVMARGPAGHIERLLSGAWRVKVYAGTDLLTGREIRLRKKWKTERAAQIELGKQATRDERDRDWACWSREELVCELGAFIGPALGMHRWPEDN
jgi:hypothetical protein